MNTATGYAEMFEWYDGNVNAEDRAGTTVVLFQGKIIESNKASFDVEPSDIIGVVGGDNTSVAVISNGSPEEWHGKHLRDAANRLVWEKQVMVEWLDTNNSYRHWYEADRIPEGIVPPPNAVYHNINPNNGHPLFREILSEEYKNPGKHVNPYLPRWDRQEWAIVVLLGRVVVREGSVCNSRWKEIRPMPGMLGNRAVSEWLVR